MGTCCVWFKGCEFNILFIRYLFNLLISVCSDNKRCGSETMFAADEDTFSSKIFSLIVDFFGCHDFFFKFKLGTLNGAFSSLLFHEHFFLPNKFQFFTFDKIRYWIFSISTTSECQHWSWNFQLLSRNYKVGIFNF